LREHIDGEVWHLDVDSSFPRAEEGAKGLAVRQLKGYVSWVKIVVRQIGHYLLLELDSKENRILVREDQIVLAYSVPVV